MLVLIDGDIVAYRAACSCEDIPTLAELAAMDKSPDDRESLIQYEPIHVAFARMEDTLHSILETTGATEYKVFLSGEHDFRLKANPEYKANRKDVRRPLYLQPCREYLVSQWDAEVTDGIEADDAMGIAQMNRDDTCIASIDKDLLQIPGLHYNFVKKEFQEVTDLQAEQWLWQQMLIGDTADNIIGVDGIGPKKAAKLIEPLLTTEDMYTTVFDLYNDEERFNKNLTCLRILKEPLDGR